VRGERDEGVVGGDDGDEVEEGGGWKRRRG